MNDVLLRLLQSLRHVVLVLSQSYVIVVGGPEFLPFDAPFFIVLARLFEELLKLRQVVANKLALLTVHFLLLLNLLLPPSF